MRDPVLSDDSGYFVSGVDVTQKVMICKYLFSSSATSQCQQITSFRVYGSGTLKLSDNSFFLVGSDIATPWSLHLYKMTFGSTTPTWALKMNCFNPSSGWSVYLSETVVISSTIYSFFLYGTTSNTYGYGALLDLNTGSVSLRYKSSITCQDIYSSIVSGDYIAVALTWSVKILLLYNTATNTFNIRSSIPIYGVNVEVSNGR